jgi:ABC-type nitrate/sulfonate/bicarbonate transport system substrate-binding protein
MKLRKATILGILFVLVTASIFISMRTQSANAQILRIGYLPYSVNLVTFVAHEESFLKEAGFSVQLVPFQSTDALASALVNDEVDVASALTAEAVYSLNQRKPALLL